jgi:hypothetical protein
MNILIQKSLSLLGHEAIDIITKKKGVITSMSFDVSGCIQALIVPKQNKGEDKSFWVDTKRLKNICKNPVMIQPDFSIVPGGEFLPIEGKE